MEIVDIKRLDDKELNQVEIKVIEDIFSDSLLYTAALKEMQTRLDILRDDFKRSNAYNPIEHIKIRIKQPNSIIKKAYMRNIPIEAQAIRDGIDDIAGIRVVCTFKSDIYRIVEILKNAPYLKILKTKDYITNPKESGYQSYHIIAEIPVYMSTGMQQCKIEVQLRTMAMDFWACLEHKIKYKYDWCIPKDIKEELYESSKIVDILDDKMQRLHRRVHNPNEEQVESNL